MSWQSIRERIIIKTCSILTRFFSLRAIVMLLRLKLIRKKFVFDGHEIEYIFHSHNNMGLTERTVELGIAKHYLEKCKPENLLEVGNVLIYYYDFFKGLYVKRTAVDLGEEDFYVIKKDIVTFKTETKFDFILSVSTFEHMDENDFRPPTFNSMDSTVAAHNIKYCYENLLAENGTFVLTAALGWEKEWDRTFKTNLLDNYPFKSIKKFLLKRASEQEWRQVEDIQHDPTPYGSPHPFGNWLSVIEISK